MTSTAMPRSQRWNLIGHMAAALERKGSWTGETHLQKACYFLQTFSGVPLGFDYILYKHGPYSFALSDEIDLMKTCDRLLPVRRPPYGPTLRVNPTEILNPTEYDGKIDEVAEWLGDKGVSELERLATALMLLKERCADKEALVQEFVKFKPHVSEAMAREALAEVERRLQPH